MFPRISGFSEISQKISELCWWTTKIFLDMGGVIIKGGVLIEQSSLEISTENPQLKVSKRGQK